MALACRSQTKATPSNPVMLRLAPAGPVRYPRILWRNPALAGGRYRVPATR